MEYKITIDGPEELETRIIELKAINDAGIDYSLFWNVLRQLRNGVTSPRPADSNSFDSSGWSEFLSEYGVQLSPNQIELIFNYTIKYHRNILRKDSSGNFQAIGNINISEDENPFGFEMISLNSLTS